MATYASSEKTRENLITAAGELAAEQGFQNISLRAVATRAGENVGSIHYHFGSKEALLKAVIVRVLDFLDTRSLELRLEELGDELDTPQGQAMAIRIVVQHEMNFIFDDGRLHWYCRVVYQLMQVQGSLRDFFYTGYIKPLSNVVQGLLQRIRPDFTKDQLHLQHAVLVAPLVFHDDYIDINLGMLGKDSYSPEYIQQLEDLVVLQNQLSLGLPPDKAAIGNDVLSNKETT